MVKISCSVDSNNDACHLHDMRCLTKVMTIICVILFVISCLSYLLSIPISCYECRKYTNMTFTGHSKYYDADDDKWKNQCTYQSNGQEVEKSRVMSTSCRNRILIIITVLATTPLITALFFSISCCQANGKYNFLNADTYPNTGRCQFNIRILGYSLLFGLWVVIFIATLPITIPLAIIAGIMYVCYLLFKKFCLFTCRICICEIKEDNVRADSQIHLATAGETAGELL